MHCKLSKKEVQLGRQSEKTFVFDGLKFFFQST